MNKTILLSTLLLSILWIASCSEEKNPVTTGEDPIISKTNLNNNWSTQSTNFYKTEVWVNDPQGLDNLTVVYLSVFESSDDTEIFSDSLYDEGSYYKPEAGDVLAGDGVFSNRFRTSDITDSKEQTEYIFRFVAIDKQNNESQIWENLVSFVPNSLPVIHQISAPDSFSSHDENTVFIITVSDEDGIEDVVKGYFESENLANGLVQYEMDMFNDGDFENHGDLLAGDSLFSTRVFPGFLVGKKGAYKLIFHVEDTVEEENIDKPEHFIHLTNFAGQINNLNLPEVMTIPSEPGEPARELMTAEVTDSEGLADIDSVYFFSLKPDSTYANNGQPFIMVDNGLSYDPLNPLIKTGDETSGDGVYSLSLLVFNGSIPGDYTFSFYIRDKAGNLTGPVKRTIQLTH